MKFLTYKRLIFSSIFDGFRIAYKGVPQCGVLSPLLYTLYVRLIEMNLSSRVCRSQFSDDIALYFTNLNSLQKAITTIMINLSSIGLDLAPQKTILIHCNNKNILPGDTVINIGNVTIKSSESVRFLGVIFDYKLSFVPHINKLLSKCQRALNIIKFIRRTWWGADPSTLLIFYKSFVRSLIDYGCFIYFPYRKDLKEKIE